MCLPQVEETKCKLVEGGVAATLLELLQQPEAPLELIGAACGVVGVCRGGERRWREGKEEGGRDDVGGTRPALAYSHRFRTAAHTRAHHLNTAVS